jgi:hypothetical protein
MLCYHISMKGNIVPLPENSPKVGETYKHYKGDSYEVVTLALHSNDEEWMVVYKPLYDCPDAELFTLPLREWREEIEWPEGSGSQVGRFTHVHSESKKIYNDVQY